MNEGQEKGQEEEASLLPENGLSDGGFQTTQLEQTVSDLKREKATAKAGFTKVRRCLLTVIQREDTDSVEIKGICEELDVALGCAMNVMERLYDRYKLDKDSKSADKLSDEIEKIEIEYSNAQNRAQEVLDSLSTPRRYDKFLNRLQQQKEDRQQPNRKEPGLPQQEAPPDHQPPQERSCPESVSVSNASQNNCTDPGLIGLDLWKQLKRVTIPVFSGDKKTYQNWKAAFTACVDNAPATPEYKLLQLRQCLAGEALKAIDSLGHSATAYHTAKERLERKFGGQRRQIALYLEEVDNFRPINPGSHRDIEKFADLLDVTIVNLKEANRFEELNDGLLYLKLQKKLPTTMLSGYHRWIFENHKRESVESLREWVIQEVEFQTKALEAVHGFSTVKSGRYEVKKFKKDVPYSFFGKSNVKQVTNEDRQSSRVCGVCSKPHGAWACPDFKQMDLQNRWDCAKQCKLCFCCLGDGHLGQYCNRTRICGIDNCKEVHHRLLHKDRGPRSSSQNKGVVHGKEELQLLSKHDVASKKTICAPNEGEPKATSDPSQNESYTTITTNPGTIALRTIPVYLRNGNRKIKVNALLDDASTKTYINSDVAAELGLQGQLQKVNVSVLNGHVEAFETSPVECTIESLDGRAAVTITALTADRVTGELKAIDWKSCAAKWAHLQHLEFPKLGS
ncbi:uncharacterized protein [Dysidea avara]|uniref:uncharacterized protein n=1 Tax=Dysidea avara TaxID=196820 RepID=UPI0033311A97